MTELRLVENAPSDTFESASAQVQVIPFNGDQLQAVAEGGKVWVVVRRVCEALGVDPNAQQQRLRDVDRTPWAVACMTHATGPDGKNYEFFCVDLDCLPMWLATIDVGRVRAESKAKLIAYQRECARVLRNHFLSPRPKYVVPETRAALLREAYLLAEEVERLEAEKLRLAAETRAKEDVIGQLLEENNEKDDAIAELAPKAEIHDRFMAVDGDLSVEEFAKLNDVTEPVMFAWLRQQRLIFQKPGRLPTADAVRRGYLSTLVKTFTKKDGTEVPYTQARITPLGVSVLGTRFQNPEPGISIDEELP